MPGMLETGLLVLLDAANAICFCVAIIEITIFRTFTNKITQIVPLSNYLLSDINNLNEQHN